MAKGKTAIPLLLPPDIWEPLAEVRAQLDTLCPGPPSPIEEVLREVITHYKGCSRTEDEIDAFCERAKMWKQQQSRET